MDNNATPSIADLIDNAIKESREVGITHGHVREATHTLNNAAWRLRHLDKEVFAEWLQEQLKKINDKDD